MSHANKVPLHETKPIKNIIEAVSHLVMPDLSGLVMLYVDMKEGVSAQRTVLLRNKEQIRAEGFEAATRLMQLDPVASRYINGTYFDRLNRKGGSYHE